MTHEAIKARHAQHAQYATGELRTVAFGLFALPETCCNVTMHLPQYYQGKISIERTSLDTQTLWRLAFTSPLNHAVEQQGSQRALWVSNLMPMSIFICFEPD